MKIAALVISGSSAVLASLLDSITDILCGVVLFVAIQKAQRGIRSGHLQHQLHSRFRVQTVYARRFQTLGILAYASIMGALSLVFAVQNIVGAVRIVQGASNEVVFDDACMWLVGIVIVLKIALLFACARGQRSYTNSTNSSGFANSAASAASDVGALDTLHVYVKDHGFDVIQNALVLLGARIATVDARLQVLDKIISVLILGYISVSWTGTAVEKIRSLSGRLLSNKETERFLSFLLFGLPQSILLEHVQTIVGYQSGAQTVLEIILCVDAPMPTILSHAIC